MRIQHNIMAMNAYRNYTNNVSAMKANLEKLSSGYKINRAGDDAAGLAISEKMRAQITGLETAQKNAKDGISLVQTAEGALTEVHDMLNRMVELATMSANGTYDNETDRAQLQKEMDQLNSEINRIADSANFNGIKLLDGSLATTTTEADELGMNMSDVSAMGALTHLADGVEADSPAVKTKFELDLSQVKVVNAGQALDVTALNTAVSAAPTLSDEDADDTATTITYSFADFTMPTDADGNVIDGGTIKFTFAGQEIEVKADSTNDTAANSGTADDGVLDAEDMVAAIVAKFAGTEVDINGVKFTVGNGGTGNEDKLVLTEVGTDDGNGNTVYDDSSITAASDAPTITAAAGNPAQAERIIQVNLGGHTDLDGGTDITIAYNKTMSGKEIAAEFVKNLGSTKEVDINGTTFTVSNDNGKLTFEEKEDPTGPYSADLTATLKVFESDGTTVVAQAGGDTAAGNENNKGVTINQGEGIGVNIVQKGKSAETRHMAQATVDLTQIGGIKDGTALKIGDETYVFAVGADSEYKDSANVIDLTHMKLDDAQADLAKEASRVLSNVAKDNKMFLVTTDNTTGTIRLTERLNSGIDYNKNNLQGADAKNLNDASAADWKDLIQVGIANPDAKPAVTSGGLVLQIGDTADDYNQLRVSINDCHVAALGLDKISISDQSSAATAVDVIKDAINYVSDVRGTLGATQNRLDHTINNLSVMTENIQDAESTIRDTDVAEEMMAYTKNNILIQSAQAMLAQANQVPQGVLQLLQ